MSSRERILAIMVGGAVVALIGYQGFRSFIYAPYQELLSDVADARKERGELRMYVQREEELIEQWRSATAQTLGVDLQTAQSDFRQDLFDLLTQAGFREPQLRPATVQRHYLYGKPQKQLPPFEEVSIRVETEGLNKQLARFLQSFYEQPYRTRIPRMRITVAQESRRGGRGAPARAPDGPMLNIDFTATALVLPELREVEHVEPDPTSELGRLAFASESYGRLSSANVFQKYEPPAPPVVVRPPPDREPEPEPEPDPGPPPPPPPPAWPTVADKTLIGVEAINGAVLAKVRPTGDYATAPEELQLGSEVDDGEVVLIHPRGLVVRFEDKPYSPDEPLVDYFYPLGEPFSSRERVDPDQHPFVYHALALVSDAVYPTE